MRVGCLAFIVILMSCYCKSLVVSEKNKVLDILIAVKYVRHRRDEVSKVNLDISYLSKAIVL